MTMEAIITQSPLPTIVLDPLLRVVEVSQTFLNETALLRENCVGVDVFVLLGERSFPQDACATQLQWTLDIAKRTQTIQRVHQIAIGNHPGSMRVVPILKDDALLYFVLEWHKVTTSVDEQHLEMDEPDSGLSTNEAFKIFVENVNDYAIFLLDTRGCVVTWNKGAELIKQYKRDEIIGKHFSIFYGQTDLQERKPQRELEVCLVDGRIEDEGWRYRKDGSRFWANVIIHAVYSKGVHVGFGKVTRDLTERKAAELQVIAAYEESDNLKSQFLANMSHEIRTPMHGMLSANLLLLGTQLTDDQLDLANIIEESGQVLLQVINDILDYSKLAAGGFSVISDIMNITQIINSVSRGYQMTLKHGVTFDLRLSPDLPKIVKGDSLRYRQVVQNLLSNGSKFTEHGSVSLQVSVSEELDDGYTILTEIIDTGIGISDSAGRLLFTPFTQFDTSRTKRFQGTGLGLSISKSLTELMGGHIKFRPNPTGRGSIFSFTVKVQKLPIESPTPAQLQLATENLHLTLTVDPADLIKTIAASKRLLLAEDNPINQRIMLKVLKALGFTNIEAVSDGVEAVRMMTSSDTERPALSTKSVPASDPGLRDEPNVDFPPESSVLSRPAAQRFDLILMDINMPRMDGFGATTAIRNLGVWVPIVAMTANALRGDREQCIRNGMNDYISKPVKREQLVEVLKRWLIDGTPTWTGGAGTSRRASVLGLGLSDTTNSIES